MNSTIPDPTCALRDLYRGAHRANAPVDLGFDVFADTLLERLKRRLMTADARRLTDTLRTVAATDFYLIVACERHVDGAWELLYARERDRLEAHLLRRGHADAASEVSSVLGDLFLAQQGEASPAAGFAGESSLFTWVLTILRRRRIDGQRGATSRADVSLEGTRDIVAPLDVNPALVAMRREASDRLQVVLSGAFESLTPRERDYLRLRVVDRWPQRRIADTFRVHESVVSKTFKRGRRKLIAASARIAPDVVPRNARWQELRDACMPAVLSVIRAHRVAVPTRAREEDSR